MTVITNTFVHYHDDELLANEDMKKYLGYSYEGIQELIDKKQTEAEKIIASVARIAWESGAL